MSLNLNTPQVRNYTGLNAVPSGSTIEPDTSVLYTPQILTEEQQAQARQNIGAISESEIPASAQANWNETDTESPAYIQNKPTIPADVIPEDESRSFKVVTDSNMIFNNNTNDLFKVYSNGSVVTPDSSKNYLLTRGVSRFVYTRNVDWDSDTFRFTYFSRESIFSDWNAMTIVRFGDNAGYLCGGEVDGGGNKKIFTKILTTADNGSVLFWGGYENRMCTPYSTNSVVFYNKYVWSQGAYGTPVFYGKIIFDNVEVPTNTFDLNSDALPDVTNLEGIYVHRSKETAYKAWLTGLYQSGVDLSAVLAKVKVYDFLADYDENIPGDYPMPMTIPAQIQSDWNQSDDTAVDYIKNKPTIPAASVQSNWNESDTSSLAYIQNKPVIPVLPIRTNNNLPILIPEDYYNMIAVEGEVSEWGTDTDFSKSKWYQYDRGQLIDDSGSGNYQLRQGYNVFVKKAGDLTSTSIKFGYKAGNYKIKIGTNALSTQGTYLFTENTAYTGNITIMWGYHAADVYRHRWGGLDSALKLPICTSMYTYLMYNQWPKDGSGSRLYGNLVLVDKPFDLRGADNHDASLPDMTNVTAVYVPKARATEFASFMDYGYGSGNWSTIEAKVVYYDFLTWIDDMTPKIVVLPTVPLTMTD